MKTLNTSLVLALAGLLVASCGSSSVTPDRAAQHEQDMERAELPAEAEATGDAQVGDEYGIQQIASGIRDERHTIRACYENELESHPGIGGEVVMRLLINPDGTVSNASIAESALENAAVEGCLVEEFSRLNFPEPASAEQVSVDFPLTFSHQTM